MPRWHWNGREVKFKPVERTATEIMTEESKVPDDKSPGIKTIEAADAADQPVHVTPAGIVAASGGPHPVGTLLGVNKDGHLVPYLTTGKVVVGVDPASPPYTATDPVHWDKLEKEFRSKHREEDQRATRVGLPIGGVDLDAHFLLVILQKDKTTFAMGARDRLQGFNPRSQDNGEFDQESYDLGFQWADRIIEGRKLLAYIEEGDP